MAAPKPAPKPRKPLSYDDTLNRQFMGSIYSGCYYRKYAFFIGIPELRAAQRTNEGAHGASACQRPHRSSRGASSTLGCSSTGRTQEPPTAGFQSQEDTRASQEAEGRPTRKGGNARDIGQQHGVRLGIGLNQVPPTYTYVTTPDARKPVLRLADITEEDRAKHWEMWACRRRHHHDEATRKAVVAAARKPVDYSLLPPRRRPICLVKQRKSQATTSNDQSD
ncbi:hypothetical protein B0H14DRAFT_2626819 [Mycena olivaceomarginata]|nr:hypothetical protein B0H14DRAFT_2626819 [Mycena olivaceomarginata]